MLRLLIVLVMVSFLCPASLVFGESFYTYTDENGKVHYTNVAPSKAQNVKKKELKGRESTYEKNEEVSSSDEEYESSYSNNSHTTKKKKKRIRSSKQNKNAICNKAVREVRETIKMYLSTAKKNMEGGYITKAEYNKAKKLFASAKREATVQDCMISKGKDYKMYKCAAENYGDVLFCLDKYK